MKRIVSLLLTISLLATFALFAVGSGNSETTKVEPAATGKQATGEQKEEGSKRTEIRVGETLNMNEFKITYDSVEKWVSDNQFVTPHEGKMFIRLHFTVVNDTSSDQFISSIEFECYADGEACDSSIYGDDHLSATLSAGRKTSGYVYFEVPESAEAIEVEYETDIWSNKKAYFIVELG